MKKLFSLLLIAVLCCSLTACVGDTEPQKELPDGASVENGEGVFGLNETAVFDNLKFTATEIKESKGVEYYTPAEGNVFVGVKFTIENISEEQTVSTLLSFEGYADDVKCSYSFNAAMAFNEGTVDGNILPGKKLVGWYALEVPETWSTIELQVKNDLLSSVSAKFIFEK